MTTTADLATDLGGDEGDICVLLRQLGERSPDLPGELAAFPLRLLDQHGTRVGLTARS